MLQNVALNLSLSFDQTLSVREKWKFVEIQVRRALSPRPGSGLIDQGQIIPGYHCPRADDDPTSPMKNAPGRAPDIGAFEFAPSRPSAPTRIRVVQ
jgi:hypothetical protein